MGRVLPIAAAILIVIAGAVWLLWPASPKVRPAPGSPVAVVDPAKPPALATAGGRSAAGDAIPAGERRPERATAPSGAGAAEREPSEATGAAARAGATKERAAGEAGTADEQAAGDAAPKKKEMWEGSLVFRARVLDVGGKPVAGLKVRLHDGWPWPGAPPRPVVETDSEGRFAYADLPSNSYQVWVVEDAGERPFAFYVFPGSEPLDLTLKPATPRVTPPGATPVRVVGADGTPIPQASVQVRQAKRPFGGGYIDVVDGTFFRGPLDDGATSYAVSRAETSDGKALPFGPATWIPKAGQEDVVTLPRGMSIAGRVVGPDGSGVFGAEVLAVREPPPGTSQYAGTLPMESRATSDATGAFQFVNLGEGPYRLQATPVPPYLASEEVATPVAVDTVVLKVALGLEADVTVLDGDGKPVAGASVSAGATGFPHVRQGRGAGQQITDPAGRAHLSQLTPGIVLNLQVSAPSSRKDLSWFTQKAWEIKDTTVTLPRAWTVKGVVRRADGAAGMSFVHKRSTDGAWAILTPTKKDGTFELKFTEPGPWILAASVSFDTPRGAELTITDPALAVELSAPPAAATPPTGPTK
jgi:hypothetical protein